MAKGIKINLSGKQKEFLSLHLISNVTAFHIKFDTKKFFRVPL